MNTRKESKLNMFNSVIDLCEGNLLVIALVVAFETGYNTFKTTVAAIVSGMNDLEAQTGGYAISKKTAKNNLAILGSGIAGMVYAYAASINNETLKEAMNIPASKIKKALDDEVINICNNIYTTANGLIANLGDFGVTAALLLTFNTAITDYSSKSPKPKQSRNQKKAIGQQINQLFKTADNILLEQMDKLVVNFITNGNALFEEQYRAARLIDDPGSFSTVLKLLVINGGTNSPLSGAKVYRNAAGTFKRSSKKGIVTFKDIEQGNHSFVLKHKLFNDLLLPAIPIGYGIKKTVTVVMMPIGTVSNGNNVVAEGDVPQGNIFNLDVSEIGVNINSSIRVEISGGELNIYAAELLDELPGATFWHLTSGTDVTKTLPEFATLIGSSETKKKVTLQNPGSTTTHYKLTFMNLDGE